MTRTSSPIDPDIVQDISQDSVRESLSVILNELGTGLAARGSDLNKVILRADPALAQTQRVFNLLASQNRVLANLATDSDQVLAPLAKTRSSLAGFVVHANTVATASATQSVQLAQSIKLLPPFLEELKPLMADLGQLASQGTPVVKDAGSSAAALDAEFKALVPFASSARRQSRTSATPPSSPRARSSVRWALPTSWRTSAPPWSRPRRRCRSCSRASTRPVASSSS